MKKKTKQIKPAKPTGHVDFLDALRGIAILLVLICHTYAEVYGYGHEFGPWNGWFRAFAGGTNLWLYPFSWGRSGVALFFVISGLCIHLSCQRAGQTWGGFFLRRFFRLYPAYLAALVFVMAMLYARHMPAEFHQRDFWVQLSTHCFFIHNFFADTFKGVNPALWSLALEVQLYLLFPLLLALVARLGWRWTLLLLAALELFLQATCGYVEMTGATGTTVGRTFEILGRSPLGYWFSWALGAAIGDALLKKQVPPFLKIHPLIWLAVAISTDFIKPLTPFYFTAFALAAAGVISRQLNRSRPGLGTDLLSWRALVKIGLWSYSIYLLHYPMLEVYFNVVDWYFPEFHASRPTTLLLLAGTWLVIIPLAALWYKTIELPGIALGKWLGNRPAAEPRDQSVKPQNQIKQTS